jgi:hypothetical protein
MKKTLLTSVALIISGSVLAAPSADLTTIKLCKAGIATIFGRDVSIIKAKELSSGNIALQYHRADDNSLWKYECKILDGNQIMWRAAGNPSEPNFVGRWRDDPADGKVTYEINGNKLTIHDEDGVSQSFMKSKLK